MKLKPKPKTKYIRCENLIQGRKTYIDTKVYCSDCYYIVNYHKKLKRKAEDRK